MARYIDAEKCCEYFDKEYKELRQQIYQGEAVHSIEAGFVGAERAIHKMPTADVVPKSEVDRWRFQLEAVLEEIPETKREVAREIFEEIESISSDFPLYGNINTVILSERDLAFIKKKYTEDK